MRVSEMCQERGCGAAVYEEELYLLGMVWIMVIASKSLRRQEGRSPGWVGTNSHP